MDAKLGREVLDYVTAHRSEFDTMVFAEIRQGVTVADLAGHAMLQSGYTFRKGARGFSFFRPAGTRVTDVVQEARDLLRLTDEEYYGAAAEPAPLFGVQAEDQAIERFQAIVEAAEAVEAVSVHG
jgi:hypothetical protein